MDIYRLLAETLTDDALRAHCLIQAGSLLEGRLQRPEQAATALHEAFALDRRDPLLLSAEIRIAEREGRTDDLLAALTAEAEVLAEHAAPTWLRIAKVHEKLGRPEDALAALLAARKASPNEPLVLSELAQIYETQGHYEELADVLMSWVASVSDESELVAINLRLAALYEEDLKRDDAAIERYRAILDVVPGHQASLAGLGKLFHRRGDWQQLVEAFDAEIAALEDPRQQAAKMFKAAEILEERLDQKEEAITRYNRCLQLQPGYLPAQKALTRLFERQNRWAELVAMLEQDLLQTADRDEMILTLNKIASIHEERLSDPDAAIECLKRILEISPDHLPTIRRLAGIYEGVSRWQDLIALHELEATLVGDTKQILAINHRNAEILDEQLRDRAGATAAWERLLALSPSYLPALKALGRLYAQDGRWEELIRMYRAEAEISQSMDQAAALIQKIGELYEHRLKNENEAIASYQEVLTLSPSYFPALRALARIYRAQRAWESLVDVLRSEAANRTDPVERANALFQAAGIWEHQLDRPEMAIEGYQEVLRLNPGHAAALRSLERLYTLRNDLKELIVVLDRDAQSAATISARISAYLKLAYIYLDRMNEPSRAARCAEAVLTHAPTNYSALKLLERIRAGDRARRAELRLRIADVVSDRRLNTALRFSAATDREQPGVDSVLEELRRTFEANPGDTRLAFQVERQLRKTGDFAGLVATWEAQLAFQTEPHERAALQIRIADVAHQKLDDRALALDTYRAALETVPGFLPALQGLREVHLAAGEYAEARALLKTEGNTARSPEVATEAWVRAGELSKDKLGDADDAIACFRKALENDPLEPRASAGMEEILAARGGAEDLAALHERRGEALLAQKHAASAATEFFTAASTWFERVGDEAKADAAVERALEAHPTHPGALELRAAIALRAHQYADGAAALALRLQQGGEPQEVAALHLQLGGIYQDHLSDATRAAAHLQTALTVEPGNAAALERLATLHTLSRNWTGAAECLRRRIDLGGDPQTIARHTVALAQIHDEGLGDAEKATELCRRALELAPSDEEILQRLVNLYERLGNLPELAQFIERQAQTSRDPRRAIMQWLKVADLFAGPLDDPDKAIAYYRHVVDLDAGNVTAHAALASLYARDASAAPMAIEEHRTLLRMEPSRIESLHALFRLWDGQKLYDRAFCAAGILQFFRAGNEVEASFHTEARNRLPQEAVSQLQPSDLDALLPPLLRGNPVVSALRAMGDQLTKIHPPNFEAAGIDRKADRLKADHAVHKAVRAVASVFGVTDLEVYQSRRGTMFLETTSPLAVCVGQDVVRKFNAREQKFLIGRMALGLLNKTAVAQKLSNGELADLIGNSVRIFHPDFDGLGRRNDEASKQLRRAYSRKSLKALEGPALELSTMHEVPLVEILDALSMAADRAGLLVTADVAAGLNMLLREDPNYSAQKAESQDPALMAVRARPDLQALLTFAVSDDFFRLRQKIGLTV